MIILLDLRFIINIACAKRYFVSWLLTKRSFPFFLFWCSSYLVTSYYYLYCSHRSRKFGYFSIEQYRICYGKLRNSINIYGIVMQLLE